MRQILPYQFVQLDVQPLHGQPHHVVERSFDTLDPDIAEMCIRDSDYAELRSLIGRSGVSDRVGSRMVELLKSDMK